MCRLGKKEVHVSNMVMKDSFNVSFRGKNYNSQCKKTFDMSLNLLRSPYYMRVNRKEVGIREKFSKRKVSKCKNRTVAVL